MKNMDETVITSAEQVTTAGLTDVLRQNGALDDGAVASFEVDRGAGNWSANAKLKLSYSDDAAGERPEKLFLKIVNTDLGDDEWFDDSEVHYYLRDYLDVPDAPLVRCYAGGYSPEEKKYFLLLDDLSETHGLAANKTPTLEYGLALAEGLAVMHARWWGAKGLAEAGAAMHNAAHIQRFVDIAEPGVGHILEAFTPNLKPHWPDLMREVFAKHPHKLVERTKDANGFTVIHGDVGEHNVLAPRDGETPIYIIDRQPFDWSLTIWLGAYDLAYAMILDWDAAVCREYEVPVLKRYHETLIKYGVTDYSWEQLWDDYRLCVTICVYVAVEYCRGGVHKKWIEVWMMMLRRSLTAMDDLNCAELWR